MIVRVQRQRSVHWQPHSFFIFTVRFPLRLPVDVRQERSARPDAVALTNAPRNAPRWLLLAVCSGARRRCFGDHRWHGRGIVAAAPADSLF